MSVCEWKRWPLIFSLSDKDTESYISVLFFIGIFIYMYLLCYEVKAISNCPHSECFELHSLLKTNCFQAFLVIWMVFFGDMVGMGFRSFLWASALAVSCE